MASSVPIAKIENVSKRFLIHKEKSIKERVLSLGRGRKHSDDFWALKDIDFTIDAGSTIGLVGHNGSGKSTLLKILGGILEPTSGSVYRRGRVAPLLELGTGFHPDLTGRENIYLNSAILGLTKAETTAAFDAIVDFSGIEEFIDTQVKFYSSGMYVRLAFSIAIHVDPDFLLVDEVLAVGDMPFQLKCIERINTFQREGRSIAIVSHSAAQIKNLCDRVVVLESGNMLFDGSTDEGLNILNQSYLRREQALVEAGDYAQDVPALDVESISVKTKQVKDRRTSVTVAIPFENRTKVSAWECAINLFSTSDIHLTGIFSSEQGVKLPTQMGAGVLTVELPNLALAPGDYRVGINLRRADQTVVQRITTASLFHVPGTQKTRGSLLVTPEISVAFTNAK